MGSTFWLWTSKTKLFIQEAEDTDFVNYLGEANNRLAYSAIALYSHMSVSLPKLFCLI